MRLILEILRYLYCCCIVKGVPGPSIRETIAVESCIFLEFMRSNCCNFLPNLNHDNPSRISTNLNLYCIILYSCGILIKVWTEHYHYHDYYSHYYHCCYCNNHYYIEIIIIMIIIIIISIIIWNKSWLSINFQYIPNSWALICEDLYTWHGSFMNCLYNKPNQTKLLWYSMAILKSVLRMYAVSRISTVVFHGLPWLIN